MILKYYVIVHQDFDAYGCIPEITAALVDLAPIELTPVRRTPEEKLLNNLIQRYHYLGYTNPVGTHHLILAQIEYGKIHTRPAYFLSPLRK